MPVTAYRELDYVLHELVSGVRPILGENFVGAYLQGSFAVGDADESSDVDFLIVTEADVPEAQVADLQAVHVRVYNLDSYWAKHLEGSYFPRPLLRRLDGTSQPLLYVDNGSRVLERSTHDNTLVVRWVLREHGLRLIGPGVAELLDPVPADALRREVMATMREWAETILADPEQMNNGWYQPYAVLSYCRMLHTLATGRVGSKRAGAAWAAGVLDSRWAGLIERAWDSHVGQFLRVPQKADPADFESTPVFIREVLAVSDQYAGETSQAE